MNAKIAAQEAVERAHRARLEALASLQRTKQFGDTQAQNRAQKRVDDATHRLMMAEREAARV